MKPSERFKQTLESTRGKPHLGYLTDEDYEAVRRRGSEAIKSLREYLSLVPNK